jgi:hypothetical protein
MPSGCVYACAPVYSTTPPRNWLPSLRRELGLDRVEKLWHMLELVDQHWSLAKAMAQGIVSRRCSV